VPPRSLVWRTPAGPENLLISPALSTIAALDINPNPESYGAGSPGAAGYAWQLTPNAGGLPLVGNAGFSLTVASDVPQQGVGVFAVATSAIAPLPVLGINLLVDPGSAITVGTSFADAATLPLGIPATPSLVGAELFAQAILIELPLGAFAASPGVSLTVL
jgi:hypothetical protein